MKRFIFYLTLLIPMAVAAQDNPPPPEDQSYNEEGMRPPPPDDGMPPRERFRHEGPPPGEMVERWLEKLKQTQPEEYERLSALREKDPEAFREELHKRLRQERMQSIEREHPRIAEAFKGLPPDDRSWLMNRLEKGGPGGPMGPRPEMTNPEIARAEEEARNLAWQYRNAKDDDQRTKLRADLRTRLEALFDLRQKERENSIRQAEGKLEKLRHTLEDRETHKGEILEQRLREMTEGETWAW